MFTRELERIPELGIVRMFHYDPDTDESTIETIQDVESIITASKDEFKEYDERAPWKGDFHRVASIPLSIFSELQAKGVIENDDPKKKKLMAWLNNPDQRAFRTRPGWL
jgi:hypothetical protein